MDRLREKIERVKEGVRIETVAANLGLSLKKVGRVYRTRCLVASHDDKDPSFTIDPGKQRYKCFGCGTSGDVVDLVKLARGMTLGEALAYLDLGGANRSTNGGGGNGVHPPTPQELLDEPATLAVLVRLATHYQEVFRKRPEGREYLSSRGLTDVPLLERLGAGYCDGSGKSLLSVEDRRRLSPLGLFNERGNECFYKCVTFPLTDREGRVVGLYGRGIDSKRHLYLAGPRRGVFKGNGNGVRGATANSLVLAESVLDAIAWLAMGATDATAIYGVHGFSPELEAYLASRDLEEIVLAMDGDAEGEKATARLAPRVGDLGISRVRTVTYPEGAKDAMDLLLAGGAPVGRRILDEARPVGEDPPSSAPTDSATVHLRLAGGELTYRTGDLSYRIAGLDPRLAKSRPQLVFVRRGDLVSADEFRFLKGRDRGRFVQEAAKTLGLQPARLEDDFAKIVAYVEAQSRTNGAPVGESRAPPRLSPEARREALAFLSDPSLLERIVGDIETVGYVGDPKNKLLVYLVALSRRLEKPLSGVIKSTTGAGKSALMEAVVELIPPEEVRYLSRITPAALYHFPKDELVHKLLVIDEAEGLQEALYPLRTFQERRKITLASPTKDPATGELQTRVKEILGPSAVLYATTRARMNREDENRSLPITLLESLDHTRRIHEHQKSLYTLSGYDGREGIERVKNLHHNAQRLLEPVRVLIPYLDRVVFPDVRPETTRDVRRVLALVEVLAYLQQFSRKKEKRPDGHTYIEATTEDYKTAYELAAHLVWASLDDLAPQERRLYEIVQDLVGTEAAKVGVKPQEYVFSRREIREKTGLSQDHLKRYLRRLVELELLLVAGRWGTGGHHVYRLALPEVARPMGHLTAPDELAQESGAARVSS